jgi:hypothetical protein
MLLMMPRYVSLAGTTTNSEFIAFQRRRERQTVQCLQKEIPQTESWIIYDNLVKCFCFKNIVLGKKTPAF